MDRRKGKAVEAAGLDGFARLVIYDRFIRFVGGRFSLGVTELAQIVGQPGKLGIVGGIEAKGVMTGSGWDAPEDLLDVEQGIIMGDREGGRVEAVIGAGTGAKHGENGAVVEDGLEAEETGLFGGRDEVINGRVEGRGDAGETGEGSADVGDADLGVDGAGVDGELGEGALGGGMRVADEACGSVDDGVFGVLAVARALAFLKDAVLDGEGNLEVGMTAGLGGGDGRGVETNRRVGLRGGGKQPHRDSHAYHGPALARAPKRARNGAARCGVLDSQGRSHLLRYPLGRAHRHQRSRALAPASGMLGAANQRICVLAPLGADLVIRAPIYSGMLPAVEKEF